MVTTEKATPKQQSQRRNLKKPGTKAKWLWLACSLLLYGGVTAWNFYALKTQKFPGPSNDPFRIFGIIAFVLVVFVMGYTLRRRFVRVLPGHVQDWLWLHTWFGIISILIAFQHSTYQGILNSYGFRLSYFLEAGGGMSALYALLLLVMSGIIVRLIDTWQAHVIAVEARRNGVGIEDRLQELQLLIERLSAGKSEGFKDYSEKALKTKKAWKGPLPECESGEQKDFARVCEALHTRVELLRSLRKLEGAQSVIQLWRYVHIPLAVLAFLIICIHSLIELAKMVLPLFVHK
jgi:hypothetical protein